MKKNDINEVAPPGSSGSVRAMLKKHSDKFGTKGDKMNPYAIAWAMHNKKKGKGGVDWQYKPAKDKDTTKGPVPEKKKHKKHGKKSFAEWVENREQETIAETVLPEGLTESDISQMSAFELAQKLKNKPRPKGVGAFAYAVMLKHKRGGSDQGLIS